MTRQDTQHSWFCLVEGVSNSHFWSSRAEQIFEREQVLGRDAASVFPTEAREAQRRQTEVVKEALGLDSSRFISETEVSSG